MGKPRSATSRRPHLVTISGGLGGARMLPALRVALPSVDISAIVNVGDDFTWHGLKVCPDIDTVCYALAGEFSFTRGFGREADSTQVAAGLAALSVPSWAMLGDSDVAVSMRRSQLLAEGVGLSEITEKISMALGSAGVEVLASSDHESLTMLRLAGGDLVPYSRWFVDRDAAEEIAEVVLSPAPASSGALERLGLADAVVLAPSNPVASLGAVLALGGMEEAFLGVPRRIGVLALSGRQPPAHPALARRLRAQARLLAAIGSSPAPAGHARLLSRWVTDLIVDDHDFEAIDASLRTYGPARHLRLIGASILDDPALASCIAGLLAEP